MRNVGETFESTAYRGYAKTIFAKTKELVVPQSPDDLSHESLEYLLNAELREREKAKRTYIFFVSARRHASSFISVKLMGHVR